MLLTISNLYPRPDQPACGVFNAQFFDALAEAWKTETRNTGSALRNICLVPSWRVCQWRAITRWRDTRQTVYLTRYLPVFYLPVAGRLWNSLFYTLALRQIRDLAMQCDIVFATWLYPDCVAAAQLARKCELPLWIKVHGGDILHLGDSIRGKAILKTCHQAEGIICVSRLLVQQLVDAGIDAHKVHSVDNGVNSVLFHPINRDEALKRCRTYGCDIPDGDMPPIVLFVGRLVGIKGLTDLLSAWQQLLAKSAPRPRLWILGEGELEQTLENQAKSHGIDDTISFLGTRPHDEIPYWMNAADCVCLPSTREGMPNVVLESLACGKPVVASDVGEVPYLVTQGKTGLVVSRHVGDFPAHLACAIRQALETPWDSRTIAESVGHYTWEHAAQKVAALMINGWINRKPRPS